MARRLPLVIPSMITKGRTMDEWDSRVNNVAQEIEQYLKTHPEAADSLEGIATWWVSRQRIRAEMAVVRAALERLAAAGVVTAGQASNKDGPVYRLKKEASLKYEPET